ncbi:hypothetical protein EMGBD1_20410 [Anaerolineaceae bacterium]|nr:hypothetical protein EMGBD1_20410 [Anaerolineaceae bacterium]
MMVGSLLPGVVCLSSQLTCTFGQYSLLCVRGLIYCGWSCDIPA